MSPLNAFCKWIETWGTYICLIALLIEAVHFGVWVVAVWMTLIQDGIEGFKAMLYLLCCKPLQHSQRISKRHDRLRKRDWRQEDVDPLNTSAEDGVQGNYTVTNAL